MDDLKHIGEIPCARNSLLAGIASGFGIGVIRGINTSAFLFFFAFPSRRDVCAVIWLPVLSLNLLCFGCEILDYTTLHYTHRTPCLMFSFSPMRAP